jgi:surfeit locus 1 family protein
VPSPYDRFIDRQAGREETAPPFGIEVQDFLKAIPNNHFEYALTWWALAATNVLILGIFLASRRKREAAEG